MENALHEEGMRDPVPFSTHPEEGGREESIMLVPLPITLLFFLFLRRPPASPPVLTRGDRLLVISPGDVATPESVVHLGDVCTALAHSGVRRLLLREPQISQRQLDRLVLTLLPHYPRDGLLLHEKCPGAPNVAAAHGLGLHLKSTSDWRAQRASFRGPLGVSAHSEAEARLAADCGCQWAFLSPVARPTSKPGDVRPPIGEAAILRAQRSLHDDLDIVALGGITPQTAARLAAGGGRGVAVLGGVFSHGHATSAEQAKENARAYLEALASIT